MIHEDRLRRDLAWCLASAPLVIKSGGGVIWPDDDWLRGLPPYSAGAPLPRPRDRHHFRLGQHFEKLLATWLDAADSFDLLAANLQVQDGKRTVGEFDLLVEHESEVEHWEAAVKFYLGTGDGRSMACWYGPNTADRFDIKYARLVAHQLNLANNEHATETLAARHIKVARSRCFMKGRLFHPWERFAAADFAVPPEVNPAHEKGWWLSHGDFLAAFADGNHRFVYLPKILWLAPLSPADLDAPLSFWELEELLESPHCEQATHVALVTDAGEISRGFITKNQWLERLS